MRCDQLADVLTATPGGLQIHDPDARTHVDTCLRCQAEMVQYRRLTRSLRSLKEDLLEPGPGLVVEILAGLEAAGARQAAKGARQGRTVAYVGGFAVATAAAGAGAMVLASRGSKRRVRIAG